MKSRANNTFLRSVEKYNKYRLYCTFKAAVKIIVTKILFDKAHKLKLRERPWRNLSALKLARPITTLCQNRNYAEKTYPITDATVQYNICLAFNKKKYLAKKPDISRCICSNRNSLGFHAEIQIIHIWDSVLPDCGHMEGGPRKSSFRIWQR